MLVLEQQHHINPLLNGQGKNLFYNYFPSAFAVEVPLPIELFNISKTFINPSGFSCLPLTDTVYLAEVSELLLLSL